MPVGLCLFVHGPAEGLRYSLFIKLPHWKNKGLIYIDPCGSLGICLAASWYCTACFDLANASALQPTPSCQYNTLYSLLPHSFTRVLWCWWRQHLPLLVCFPTLNGMAQHATLPPFPHWAQCRTPAPSSKKKQRPQEGLCSSPSGRGAQRF